MPPRLHSRSNFTTKTAQDDDHQLQRRWSISQISSQDEHEPLLPDRGREGFGTFFSTLVSKGKNLAASRRTSLTPSGRRKHAGKNGPERSRSRGRAPGTDAPNSGDAPSKLGTFAGVFVPTTLNIFSILMFLRFSFILGQSGVLGMMGKFFEAKSSFSFGRDPPAANHYSVQHDGRQWSRIANSTVFGLVSSTSNPAQGPNETLCQMARPRSKLRISTVMDLFFGCGRLNRLLLHLSSSPNAYASL